MNADEVPAENPAIDTPPKRKRRTQGFGKANPPSTDYHRGFRDGVKAVQSAAALLLWLDSVAQ